MAKENEEKSQGVFDLRLRLRKDRNGRLKGVGTWALTAIVTDWC
jgi:hypothetical protein